MKLGYTVKSNIQHNAYHLKVVRTKFISFAQLWSVPGSYFLMKNRGLNGVDSDDMHDECAVALKDLVLASGNRKFPSLDPFHLCSDLSKEWTRVKLWSTSQKLIAQMSNRIFVGVPLCRDQGYLDLCVGFPGNVMKAAARINLAPKFLHP